LLSENIKGLESELNQFVKEVKHFSLIESMNISIIKEHAENLERMGAYTVSKENGRTKVMVTEKLIVDLIQEAGKVQIDYKKGDQYPFVITVELFGYMFQCISEEDIGSEINYIEALKGGKEYVEEDSEETA